MAVRDGGCERDKDNHCSKGGRPEAAHVMEGGCMQWRALITALLQSIHTLSYMLSQLYRASLLPVVLGLVSELALGLLYRQQRVVGPAHTVYTMQMMMGHTHDDDRDDP